MNIKTIIVLFTLGFLVSCSSTRLTDRERQELEETNVHSADPSFRR